MLRSLQLHASQDEMPSEGMDQLWLGFYPLNVPEQLIAHRRGVGGVAATLIQSQLGDSSYTAQPGRKPGTHSPCQLGQLEEPVLRSVWSARLGGS